MISAVHVEWFARMNLADVTPLEDAWRDAIDAVLHARHWPAFAETARLGELVGALSSSYNTSGTAPRAAEARPEASQGMAARLAFSFARDVPKGAGAVRELVAAGALAMPADGRPLRVLDYGAGLGATTWGVARALASSGAAGVLDATWVDRDAVALGVGEELWRTFGKRAGNVELAVRTHASKAPPPRGEKYDLVLLGQVLSELDTGAEGAARVVAHVELITRLIDDALDESGALVIIEPALRDRTRHLHAVRDALLAKKACGVFAPCLHADACPALAHEGDWCHEDLAVDLPGWLVPIARAAGLRWQGLTFSYLVLRRDGRSVASLLPEGVRLRVVSGALVSKGKREAFLCGKIDGAAARRLRAQRLDRHETELNRAWSVLQRGDLLALPGGFSRPMSTDPPPEKAPYHVRADTKVDVPRTRK